MEAVSVGDDEEPDEPSSSSNVLMQQRAHPVKNNLIDNLPETHDEVQPFDMSMTTTSVDDHPNNSNLIEN